MASGRGKFARWLLWGVGSIALLALPALLLQVSLPLAAGVATFLLLLVFWFGVLRANNPLEGCLFATAWGVAVWLFVLKLMAGR